MRIIKSMAAAGLASLSDDAQIKLMYWRSLGRLPNLSNPTTFTEKVCRYKRDLKDPRLAIYVDKVIAKQFAGRVLGERWVIPNLWIGSSFPARHERDWSTPFVIKANHTSGGNYFARTEDDLDWDKIERIFDKLMSEPYRPHAAEYPYSFVSRKILVEPIIGENLPDFKFFVFNGEPQLIQVDVDRHHDHRRAFYNLSWERQSFAFKRPIPDSEVARPKFLDEMSRAASQLAAGLPFARVDFYETDDGPKFGEITLFPESGNAKFTPVSADKELGDLWTGGFVPNLSNIQPEFIYLR